VSTRCGVLVVKMMVSSALFVLVFSWLTPLSYAGFVVSVVSSETRIRAYGGIDLITDSYESNESGIKVLGKAVDATVTPLDPDDYPDTFNLVFSQEADLQYLGSGSFSSSRSIWLEVVTSVKLSFSSAAQLSGGFLSFADAYGADMLAEDNTTSIAGVSPWFLNALKNESVINGGESTIEFMSYVSTKELNSPSQGKAYSKFDTIVTFVPAPVPEPASCLVAGVLFGSVVIGKRLRRRRNA